MPQVILPCTATIIGEGKFIVEELVPGDRVVAYNFNSRALSTVTLTRITSELFYTVINVVLDFPHQSFILFPETVILSRHGEMKIANQPRDILGYCRANPKLTSCRQIYELREERCSLPGYQLEWEGPEYLRVEGLLVGSHS